MMPRERRQWLHRLAGAVRGRIDEIIEVLEESAYKDRELVGFGARVEDAYYALFGEQKTLRWLVFVRAIENRTHVARSALTGRILDDDDSDDLFPTQHPVRIARRPASDRTIARAVIKDYAIVFPAAARKLSVPGVAAAVRAWRADADYFKAIRAALRQAFPEGQKGSLPSARSMATKWSAYTRSAPWSVPSKRRPRRRPKISRSRRV